MKFKLVTTMITALILLMNVSSARCDVVLKIASLSPEGSMWMTKMREGAREVARETENRVRFKFYPGGVMGDDKSVLRKIRIRQLHGGAIPSGSLSQYYPDCQIYNIPMKFKSFEEIDYVRERMDRVIVEGFEKNGFVTFGLAEGGFAYLMSDNAVLNIDVLRKQKVWIPENDKMSYETVKAFGVTPIPLSIAEVRTGLQTGLINAVAISPIGALVLQWHTQISYLTDVPLIYIYAILAIDRNAFNKISSGDQLITRKVMNRVFKDIDKQNRNDNIKAINGLKSQGIQFVKLDNHELNKWQKLASTVSSNLIKSGALSQDMIDMLEKYLTEYRLKHQTVNE